MEPMNMKQQLDVMDTQVLRRLLHLIHCLQRERGISCSLSALVGNRNRRNNAPTTSEHEISPPPSQNHQNHSFSPPRSLTQMDSISPPSSSILQNDSIGNMEEYDLEIVQEVLEEARKATDLAFHNLFQTGKYLENKGNLLEILMKCRSFCGSDSQNETASSTKYLMIYNTLVTNLIQEKLILTFSCYIKDVPNSKKSSGHTRSRSTNFGFIGNDPYDVSSSNDLSSSLPNHFTFSNLQQIFASTPQDNLSKLNDIEYLNRGLNNVDFSPEKSRNEPTGTSYLCKRSVRENMSKKDRKLSSLLSLLFDFVKLKETIGIERSTLSFLHCMSPGTHDNTTLMLVNNLVMDIEKQRSLIRAVRNKARLVEEAFVGAGGVGTSAILLLTEQNVELSPELRHLHDLIGLDFDTDSFREAISLQRFWSLISAYMDKLHSQELLIIEEIENNLEVSGFDKDKHTQTGNDWFEKYLSAVKSDSTTHELMAKENKKKAQAMLQTMSAEDIKRSLLSLLQNSSNTDYIHSIVAEKSNTSENVQEIHSTTANNDTKENVTSTIESQASTEILAKDWEVSLYDITFEKRIGRGVAGTTYLGKWRGMTVAIKVAAATEMGVDGWNAEVQSLRCLHHNNIIRLMGSVFAPPPQVTRCLILEYCDSGDLADAMKGALPPNFFFHTSISIANGLSYLHDKGIIHRDIKPENVLLHGDLNTGRYTVKLTDFGLSTIFGPNDDKELSAETGTYRWMAPEVIRHEKYSSKADTYSFSIVVWQLLTREEPFKFSGQVEAAALVALEQSRPPFPSGTPKQIEDIICRGWSENPDERPSFEELCTEFPEIEENLSIHDKVWLEAAYGHQVYQLSKFENFSPMCRSDHGVFHLKQKNNHVAGNRKPKKPHGSRFGFNIGRRKNFLKKP